MSGEKRIKHPLLLYSEILLLPTVYQFWNEPEQRVAVMDRNLKTSCHRCSVDSCQNTQQWRLQPHWSSTQSPFPYLLVKCSPGFTVKEPWHTSRDQTERGLSYSHWIKIVEGGRPVCSLLHHDLLIQQWQQHTGRPYCLLPINNSTKQVPARSIFVRNGSKKLSLPLWFLFCYVLKQWGKQRAGKTHETIN